MLEERLAALEAELRVLRREVAPRSVSPISVTRVLVCEVGDALYAIAVDRVREIVRYVRVTPVSDLHEAVSGVIDVRGTVVPVLDARKRFGHPVVFSERRLAIVLVERESGVVGLVVDAVVEVVDVDPSATSAPAGLLARALGVAAVARVGDQVVQIVDLHAVLSLEEWDAVARATSRAEAADPLHHEGSVRDPLHHEGSLRDPLHHEGSLRDPRFQGAGDASDG